MDFQSKKTSFGSPLPQRVRFEALFQTNVFLKCQKLFLTNITLLSLGNKNLHRDLNLTLDFFLSQETDPHLGKSNPSHSIISLDHPYIQCPQATEELLCEWWDVDVLTGLEQDWTDWSYTRHQESQTDSQSQLWASTEWIQIPDIQSTPPGHSNMLI